MSNSSSEVATTDEVDRAVSKAMEVIDARINGMVRTIDSLPSLVDKAILGLRELQEARFKAIDSNLDDLHRSIDPIDCDIRKEIAHLRTLLESEIKKLSAVTEERFLGVASQFSERDVRTAQRVTSTKAAVDAAFASSKETLDKIEAGFTKQIDALIAIIDTKTNNLAGAHNDLKDRLGVLEIRTQHILATSQDHREIKKDNQGLIFAILGAVVGLGGVLIAAGTLIALVVRPHAG